MLFFKRISPQLLTVFRAVFPALAAGAFLVLLLGGRDQISWTSQISVAVSILTYVFSHLLRAIRLMTIAGPITSLRARLLFFLHFQTALPILVVPFKLGEIYRVTELSIHTRDLGRSALIVLAERSLDALVLVLMCIFLILIGIDIPRWVGIVAIFFAVLIALAVFVLTIVSPLLHEIQKYIFRHHISKLGERALRLISSLRTAVILTRQSLQGRSVFLIGITSLIWFLEFCAIWFLLAGSVTSLSDFISSNALFPIVGQIGEFHQSYSLVAMWFTVLLGAYLITLFPYLEYCRAPNRIDQQAAAYRGRSRFLFSNAQKLK